VGEVNGTNVKKFVKK